MEIFSPRLQEVYCFEQLEFRQEAKTTVTSVRGAKQASLQLSHDNAGDFPRRDSSFPVRTFSETQLQRSWKRYWGNCLFVRNACLREALRFGLIDALTGYWQPHGPGQALKRRVKSATAHPLSVLVRT